MIHKITWQKWQDPLSNSVKNQLDEEEKFFNEQKDILNSRYQGPVIVGPAGIFPVDRFNLPSHLFNFWRGDTTFRITPAMIEIINYVDGIETFDLITPYRFRIAVGRNFDEKNVKLDIEKQLLEHISIINNKSNNKVENVLSEMLLNTHKFWAIYYTEENDRPKIITGKNQEEVENKIKEILYNTKILKVTYSWSK